MSEIVSSLLDYFAANAVYLCCLWWGWRQIMARWIKKEKKRRVKIFFALSLQTKFVNMGGIMLAECKMRYS
jgi:predicted permease